MSNLPLVSVLTTSYNRAKYIGEAIESLLNSTYSNWELIIVDDGSKDNTVAIARSYESKDSRIKVYENEKNLGDYLNRNQAASYAKGKYIKYLDADDKIYPYGLEILVTYMEKYPNVGYGLCSLQQAKAEMYPFEMSSKEAYYSHYLGEIPLFHKAPLSSIIKTECFRSVGGFSGKQHLGDFEMWHILSEKFPVLLMPHGVVWYREHDDQQMNDNRTDPFVPFKYLLLSREYLLRDICPLDTNQVKKSLKKVEYKIARSVLSAAKHHSFKKAKEMKNKCGFTYFQLLSMLKNG